MTTQQNFQSNTNVEAVDKPEKTTVAGTAGAATVGGIVAAIATNSIVAANPEYRPFAEYIQVGIFSALAGVYRFFAPLGNALMGRAVTAVKGGSSPPAALP